MELHVPPLLVVLAAAVAAPLVAEATRRIGLSIVVLELALGVAIGPQGLGWAEASQGAIPYLAVIGMAVLFFVAGLEIDLAAIRGELKLAFLGWAIAFGLACLTALAMRAAGLIDAWVVVAITLTTTALGVLVPILRDSGVLEEPFGRYVMAAGALGELGPILAISLALSTKHTADVQTGFTVAFLAAVLLLAFAAAQLRVPAFLSFMRRTMTRSSQLPVRIAMLLVGGLAVLAELLGLDLALGALAAGMIVGLATSGADTHLLHHKIDALAFGFLVPVFFIASGMKLDVAAILDSRAGLLLLAAFFAALVLVRVPASLLHLRELGGRQSAALGLYSATTLSLLVAITGIAVANGLMRPAEAAPLVGAGMLTVVLFPAIALRLTGKPGSHIQAVARDDRDGL
jgi:Kef-type K+ transport system membrane component KefB